MRENYRFSLRSKSLKNAQLHDEIMRLLGDWGEALNEQHMYCGGTDALLAIICKRQEGAVADLTYKYAQIVTSVLPRFFVMENVPRAKESKAFAKARRLYKESNYGLTEVVLDASRCGVPQRRNRFFCIGELNAPDNFLSDRIFANYTLAPVSVREYFANQGIELDIDAYYRHPTTYDRRAVFSVDEVAPTIRGVNRPKPPTYRHHEKDAVSEDGLSSIKQLTIICILRTVKR